eukprot:19608-Pleurochrysis_carterae.AAC.1
MTWMTLEIEFLLSARHRIPYRRHYFARGTAAAAATTAATATLDEPARAEIPSAAHAHSERKPNKEQLYRRPLGTYQPAGLLGLLPGSKDYFPAA